jgi:DNA-binding transcriptional LysR family regulator
MRDTLDLGGIDLNLLPKFRALYRRRSVSEAARDLHLTQSALSNALARMRSLFSDDLFVRTPTGMEPTALGHALAEPIDRALAGLQLEFRQINGFVPERSSRTFRIGMTQLAEAWIAPRLLAMAQAAAPEIVVSAVAAGDSDFAYGLRTGAYDFALGHYSQLGVGYHDVDLGVHDFVLMVRDGHPVLREPLTPDTLAECTFAEAVEPGAMRSEASRSMMRLVRSRAMRYRTANVMTLPLVVAETDLVALVPSWFGARHVNAGGIRLLRISDIPTAAHMRVFWHETFERDPGHEWMRSVIVRAAAAVQREADINSEHALPTLFEIPKLEAVRAAL